jgi:hypothetical protein
MRQVRHSANHNSATHLTSDTLRHSFQPCPLPRVPLWDTRTAGRTLSTLL